MATGYIGNNNVASKVSNIYVGVNNVARKVSKAYVGVNNVAKLAYSSGGEKDYLTFTALQADSTVEMTATGYDGSTYILPTLSYSLNGGKWTDFVPGVTQITLSDIDDSVRFRAKTINKSISYSSSVYCSFKFSYGLIGASGDVMSLLDKNMGTSEITINNCFFRLFAGASKLKTAPKMSATRLSNECCFSMYYNCTALSEVQDLTATRIGESCYSYMFNGCSSLKNAPRIYATYLPYASLKYMYNNCSALETGGQIDATYMTGESAMEYMFYGCSSLKIAPTVHIVDVQANGMSHMFYKDNAIEDASGITISGTIGNSGCYDMFNQCANLTKCATFDNITSVGENGCCEMYNSTSIVTAPSLNNCTSISKKCFSGMFGGCANLESVPEYLPATDVPESAYGAMFTGCVKITKTPKIYATSVGVNAMRFMFDGCTSLTTVSSPLKAVYLADKCYQGMFYGCKSLSQFPAIYATSYYLYGTSTEATGMWSMLYDTSIGFSDSSSSTFKYEIRFPYTGTATQSEVKLNLGGSSSTITYMYTNTTYYSNVPVVV